VDGCYNALRGDDWIKFKCSQRQEFVIGGYTRPRGRRVGLGSMLVGTYEGGELRFAGGVGTGLTAARLEELTECLSSKTRETSPFADLPARPGAVWVEPTCVCECAFTEWTKAGRLRHPRFLGFREDKEPTEVVREVPVALEIGAG
jgi:bifunctional non-homologous end joining protein LigD